MSDNWVGEFEWLCASVLHTAVNDVELDRQFCALVQRSSHVCEQLEAAMREKRQLVDALAEAERKRFCRTDKLKVATHVVQRERKEKKKAIGLRDEAKRNLEQLVAFLPQQRQKEVRASLASRLEAASSSNSSDVDVTASSTTFLSSAVASSGIESDASISRLKNAVAFAPARVSSLRDAFSSTATLSSLTTSTIRSDDSRRSAEFYALIVENLKNRPHAFGHKTFVLGEMCAACNVKIVCGRRGLACEDCRCVAHAKCAANVPRPCIPLNKGGGGGGGGGGGRSSPKKSIDDHSPRFAPYVPAIVVHCAMQIEQRGLNVAGLYKVPTFDRTLDDLKHQWCRNRGVPNLSAVDVFTVCQLLKDFFASLRPALISADAFRRMTRHFENVSSDVDHVDAKITFETVFDAVCDLSPTTRDTLAFLALHLQNVAKSKACKMSARRLSKIFTPLLVDGYEKGSFQDERNKCKLLEKFVELPSHYWKIILVKDV